jgi:hypothetical protein
MTSTKSTKSTEVTVFEQSPYDKLDEGDRFMIDLRIKGTPFGVIAQYGVKQRGWPYVEQTVRSWFMQGGKLWEAYQYQLKVVTDEYFDQMKSMGAKIDQGLVDSIATLSRAAQTDPRAAAAFVHLFSKNRSLTTKEDSETLSLLRSIVDGHETATRAVQGERQEASTITDTTTDL